MALNQFLPQQELRHYAFGALLGVSVHYTIFNRGEWHVYAPKILIFHFGLLTIPPLLAFLGPTELLRELSAAFIYVSYGYLTGLFSSMIIYRAFFHQLTAAGFQGPWYARITKIWHLWACRNSTNHLVLDDLHQKYGNFVRTGPSEITIYHPDVFMAVDGPRSECIKAEWYDILHPELALVTARVKEVHTSRRREWKRGFTSKALTQHEEKILRYVGKLDECLEQHCREQKVTNMRDLIFWFGFDMMGDFVLSKSFGMLDNQQWHHIIVRLQNALSLLGLFSPAPWLIQIGFKLAPRIYALGDWFDMVAFSKNEMRERLELGKSNKMTDLTHYLMECAPENTEKDSLFWMMGDSLLSIVAGSEPTAVAIIGAFCELAKHPEHAEMIYQEVVDIDTTDLKTLNRLPHLNAVITEALRLYPALLTGGNRKTTANGLTVGGTFIPPNTTIVTPRYTIARMAMCFEKPTEFIPERWSTRPEMVLKPGAYAPFGTGHVSCLGRMLALDTMKFVIARIVKKYHFRLAPGDDGLRLSKGMRDQFTTNPGPLELCFELRE